VHCEECGFVYDDVPVAEVPARLRALGPPYAEALRRDVDNLRDHPIEGTWSALEYACHLRDVLLVQRERVALALAEHEPTFTPMRREERVVELRYNDQEPAVVADQLAAAASALADVFAALGEAQWQRRVIYSYPEPWSRPLSWVGQHTIHEGVHHLGDIHRLLDASAAEPDQNGRHA
jgi:S-DNA-T family DNA segregation ATPase FtsK/SpoIIIE